MKMNVNIMSAHQIVTEFDLVTRVSDRELGYELVAEDERTPDLCVTYIDAKGNLYEGTLLLMTAREIADKIDCENYEVIIDNRTYKLMMYNGK